MKYLLLLLTLIPYLASAISPEDIKREFKVAPGKSGGIYYAYHFTADSVPEFPQGYEPVYVSHYGRHGSRWAINEAQYPLVINILEAQLSAHNLTPEGEEILRKIKVISDHAKGHAGELSPLGQRQHKGIARRMMQRTPTLFADSAKISALSSIVPRCIISMAAFSEGLKEANPALQITRSASPGDMDFISYSTPEANRITNDSSYFLKDLSVFRQRTVPKERLLKLLFKQPPLFSISGATKINYDESYGSDKDDTSTQIPSNSIPKVNTDADLFLKTLHDIAVTTQNVDLDVDLLSIFNEDELFAFWQPLNYNMYVRHANSPQGLKAGMNSARSLLNDIISRADKALIEATPNVQLRFGHDTNLIRLLALMRLDGFSESETDPDKYYAVWQDYRISPMAANLQIIFFRPVSTQSIRPEYHSSQETIDKETLVMILHNERPVTVPVHSDKVPYYHWGDLKKFWTTDF